ncbi:hypothetical protein MycrhN_0107 [Mycolicibacterium rhodesiae NBB3]|uniref:FAS1-like dehydratase domain-containing protein n=2 Tax=Mycolicibacterium rhodesiae TaxID=36814 RepID=G8RGI8_MYCRN|nr:hypothetical protein MycrhN_0107 [Mycolicibacterium rhodesiae NBB3]
MPPESPLVSPTMRERLGKWTPWGPPSPPISESDIRRWAIASYWNCVPPRLYWDRDYAASTHWGGIIAPPDFNPFAWPISRPHSTGDGRTRRRVNGGVQMQFGVPMRPGDRIQARSRIEGWQPKSGRTGDLLLVDFAHEWRNQRVETVRITVHTMVYS